MPELNAVGGFGDLPIVGGRAELIAQAIAGQDAPGFARLMASMGRGGVLFNGRAVIFDELPSYHESSDQDNTEITRLLITDWANVPVFRTIMLGDVMMGPGAGLLTRQVPQQHPTMPTLYASECRLVEGRGAYAMVNSSLISFGDYVSRIDGKAVYEVVYKLPPHRIVDDATINIEGLVIGENRRPTYEYTRYNSKELFFSDEAQPLPGQAFKWKSDDAPIGTGLSKQRQLKEVHVNWHWVPNRVVEVLEFDVLPLICGKVNATDLSGIGRAGQVLCRPPQISKMKCTPAGNPVRDVEFVFLVRLDSTWNQFLRGNGIFDEVVAMLPGGDPPYTSADFGLLWKT